MGLGRGCRAGVGLERGLLVGGGGGPMLICAGRKHPRQRHPSKGWLLLGPHGGRGGCGGRDAGSRISLSSPLEGGDL